ncbi:hypothetical protein FDUTEX481_05472 [Tolypothrix sp. PCC 7601]|nr:hypothetical protein FDUTEX481_05472 [Tolypothrix sp. PCC 7601]
MPLQSVAFFFPIGITYSYFQVNEPQFYISRKGAKAQSNKEIQISACGLNT